MYKLATDDPESTVLEVRQSLDELAREGARRMIAEALQLEVAQYVNALGQPVARAEEMPNFTNGGETEVSSPTGC